MVSKKRGEVSVCDFVIYISHDGEEEDGFVVASPSTGSDVWSIFNNGGAVEEVPDGRVTAIRNVT